jgi:hypothetical protein
MFDRLIRHRKRYEPYSPWLDSEGPRSDDHEPPMGELACIADDVEAGRIRLPPRWKLDRPSSGVQVWTMPSGRRYACDSVGDLLPLPAGEAPYQPWQRRR